MVMWESVSVVIWQCCKWIIDNVAMQKSGNIEIQQGKGGSRKFRKGGTGHKNCLGIRIEVSIKNRIKLPRCMKYNFHAVLDYIYLCQACSIYFMSIPKNIRSAKGSAAKQSSTIEILFLTQHFCVHSVSISKLREDTCNL